MENIYMENIYMEKRYMENIYMEKRYMEKRYRVDFYDMFDGWIYNYMKETENDFDTIEEAMIIRDKKNSELPESNKKCSEHFGVIDLVTREEVCCPMKEL